MNTTYLCERNFNRIKFPNQLHIFKVQIFINGLCLLNKDRYTKYDRTQCKLKSSIDHQFDVVSFCVLSSYSLWVLAQIKRHRKYAADQMPIHYFHAFSGTNWKCCVLAGCNESNFLFTKIYCNCCSRSLGGTSSSYILCKTFQRSNIDAFDGLWCILYTASVCCFSGLIIPCHYHVEEVKIMTTKLTNTAHD